MKVYHGTDSKYLHIILNEGITPRYHKRKKRKSNWDKDPSYKDMVYLSTTYPWYYAIAAGETFDKGVVFEIDLELLDKNNFFPDEDFVFQKMEKEITDIKHSYIRENLTFYQYLWQESLSCLGNICHKGTIPVSSITRYCIIDFALREKIGFEMLQPAQHVMNQFYFGDKYRALNAWCFGDIPELPFAQEKQEQFDAYCKAGEDLPESFISLRDNAKQRIEMWNKESEDRSGIEVINLG